MRADASNATLQGALDMYCVNSSRLISKAKYSILFGPNTRLEVRDEVCSQLNIALVDLLGKYLGIQSLDGIDRTPSV